MKINKNKFAMFTSEASAAVYIVCSAFVALFPDFSTKVMMALFHVPGNITSGIRVTAGGFVLGLVQIAIYSYIIGLIFAWIFNKSLEE